MQMNDSTGKLIALAVLVLFSCTDALPEQRSDTFDPPSLFVVGNRLFDEGRYEEALAVYKAAPSHPPADRQREVHWAYWAGRQSLYRQAECYDHLKQWREAALRYLMVANNAQRGTHFSRLRAADYRIVEMYEQAGLTDELAQLLDFLDRDRLERIRFLAYRSDDDFKKAGHEPPYETLRQLAKTHDEAPQAIADRLRGLPEVPPETPLPTVSNLTSPVVLVAEIKGFSFAIPFSPVKQIHLEAYRNNPTEDARSRVRDMFMLNPSGPLDESSTVIRRTVRARQVDLLCGFLAKPDTIVTSPAGLQFPGSDIAHTHDEGDKLKLHRLRMPTGEKIMYAGARGSWSLVH